MIELILLSFIFGTAALIIGFCAFCLIVELFCATFNKDVPWEQPNDDPYKGD